MLFHKLEEWKLLIEIRYSADAPLSIPSSSGVPSQKGSDEGIAQGRILYLLASQILQLQLPFKAHILRAYHPGVQTAFTVKYCIP